MLQSRKHNKGFTLIELMIVAAIISVIASVVLAALDTARANARDAQRMSDMRQVLNALELYVTDHGVYPNHGGDTYGCNNSACLSALTDELEDGEYLPAIPLDPVFGNTDQGYRYCRYNNGIEAGKRFGLIMRKESTGTWCNVQHGAEPAGGCYYYGDGTPFYGYCGE